MSQEPPPRSSEQIARQLTPDWREEWRSYVAVLAPSMVVITLLTGLAVTSVNVLGSLRAYVGGESLWSKARSEAVQHLRDFALTQNPADYAAFEAALALPKGDQQAREEMLRDAPDLTRVREGFIAGGNHPDDVNGMITLFRRFGTQPALHDALEAWNHGDDLLGQVRTLGLRLHYATKVPGAAADVPQLLHQIRTLDEELLSTEKRFSASLAEVSRLTEKVLIGSTLSATLVLSLLVLLLVRRSMHRQVAHRQALLSANEPWMLAAAAAELGLFELEIDSEHIKLDAKAASLYGLGEAEMVVPRAQLRSLILEEDRVVLAQAGQVAFKSSQVSKSTYRIRRPDGSLRHLESTGHMVDGVDVVGRRMVGVVRDVTEELEQAQRAMQRDAAEKVAQAQRAFLSRLSHELRTPLNAILAIALAGPHPGLDAQPDPARHRHARCGQSIAQHDRRRAGPHQGRGGRDHHRLAARGVGAVVACQRGPDRRCARALWGDLH